MQAIQALLDKAKKALDTSSYENARVFFANAKERLDQLEIKDSNDIIAMQAAIENGLSEIAWRTGYSEQARERAERALELSRKSGDKMMEGYALRNMGIVYSNLSDYPNALAFFQKALAINEEIGNKNGIAQCLNGMGLVYSTLSDYPHALAFCQKALVINEETGNKVDLASCLSNIGIVYTHLSDYPNALEFFQKTLALYDEIQNKSGGAGSLGNIGHVHIKLSNYSKSLEFFQKALAIFEKIGNKVGVARTIANIGAVYLALSDYPKALEYNQKAMEFFEEIGNKKGVAMCLINIGEVLMILSPPNYKTSEEQLKEALTLNRSLGTRNQEAECLKILSELYRLQERWEKADEHYQQFHEISSEIFSLEAKKQADNFAIQREIQEQEKLQAVEQAAKQARHQATESLLQRVLPAQIADRILDGEEQIADYHASTSILFADIQGFTALTADLPPYMLLQLLHDIFTRFDALTKTAGCTKIKTIGDGYMVVAGAPETCEDHAERIVRLALQMIEPLELPAELEAFLPEDVELKIRVGVHVGPIVAGVIGQDAFSYDIYSDAVNVASRMESTGEAQRIHVSADFMRHLLSGFAMTGNKDHGITFEKRGEIEIKGKGKMKTFFLCQ